MSIEIRKLTPELVEDWLGYFDGIAFGDHGEWALCYCLEGHMTRQANEELKDPAQRREHARQLILAGKMQGYLAYDGDTVAGWCNANDRENYTGVAEMFEFSKYEAPKNQVRLLLSGGSSVQGTGNRHAVFGQSLRRRQGGGIRVYGSLSLRR